MTRYERKYRRIARNLSRVDLMRRPLDLVFTDDDADPRKQDEDRRWLDFYSDEGIQLALERYGLLSAIARRGYTEVQLATRTDDERHTLVITGAAEDMTSRARLVELVVRRDRIRPEGGPGVPPLEVELEALTVDWLELRHPRTSFTPERPRLPGQTAPGLGVGERVLEMLYRVVERLELDTLANVPEYFHNAYLYSRELPFIDPWHEGQLRGLARLLLDDHRLGLSQASWAIDWGLVSRPDGTPFTWRGQLMVWPHGDALQKYLAQPAYEREAERVASHLGYRLDRETFDDRWAKEAPNLIGA